MRVNNTKSRGNLVKFKMRMSQSINLNLKATRLKMTDRFKDWRHLKKC